MKNHRRKNIIVVLFLLAIAVFVIYQLNKGTKPFKDLSVEDIEQISLSMYPPDVTFDLGEEEMEHVVELLREIVIYEEDNTYGEYNGQAIIFWLKASDGSVRNIQVSAPFVVIGGVGYQAKYNPCEALNQYANSLLDK